MLFAIDNNNTSQHATGPPWTPVLPRGNCLRDEDCSLNGVCDPGTHLCACYDGWRGHNCQHLNIQPMPKVAAYGMSPNITSWGGSIFHNMSAERSQYHLFVTEEADGHGLASWSTASQIVHAVSDTPEGPYTRTGQVTSRLTLLTALSCLVNLPPCIQPP